LIGSAINRRLLKKFNILQIVGLGAFLVGLGSIFLMYFAWQNQASFIWLWSSVCIYMFGTSFLISNATAMALDPVPKTAGIAASIIGTLQNLCSSLGAITTGIIYNNSIRNTILVMAIFGFLTLIIYVLSFRVMKHHIVSLNLT
jgi:DHA1 family bicyclomycin/chloramphenicol resistance-like MFS transporter